MFVDYYKILEIEYTTSETIIKDAFRSCCKKYHPDKNPNIDTTSKMQEINEAYLILKDFEAKIRYDVEYHRYMEHINQSANKENTSQTSKNYNYSFDDEILKKWMSNAKLQAVKLAQESIKEFKEIGTRSIKEGSKKAGEMLLAQIAIAILFAVIFGISKSCH